MSTPNTSLALPITQKMQPKPTKTEILNAMVARAKVAHDAENERRRAARAKLETKINSLAVKAARGKKASVQIWTYSDKEKGHVDVSFCSIQTPELQDLLAQYRELTPVRWDEKETRAAINAQLTGITKVSPSRLLEDPEAVKAIDQMLSAWGI